MIGHSLGGLMAINTLVHHWELFNSYIAFAMASYKKSLSLKESAETRKKLEKLEER